MEKIPTPKGLPLLGNTYDVDFVQQTASLEGLAETYGPTYEVRLMQGSYVVCSSFELFDELCDEKRFTKHPAGGLGELRHGLGDGLFTAKFGEHNWEVAHRVLVPVFGPLAISKMFDEMHGIASQLVLKWARHGAESPISSTDDFTKLTLDTIALCSMGTRFNSFYRDEVHPFSQSMTKVMLESGKRGSRAKIMNYLMRSSSNEFFGNIDIMQGVCQAIVDERRANPSDKNDLVNAMLHRRDTKTGEMMSDANITNNMITFLVAGHETTSGLLAFLFYELMKNPVELQKAQQEIDQVVGAGKVKLEHMAKLPFLTACLREAVRLHPPAAATFMTTNPENTDNPVSLCGGRYHVKSGTTFRNLIRLIQTDPKVYGSDPNAFRPERMLDENFNKYPRNAWKPFGNGSRGCIGQDFAWQEATLALTMLLQNFDFRLADPAYELQIQQTLTVKPHGMFMHATPRQGLHPVSIERRLHASDSAKSASPDVQGLTTREDKSNKPMSVFFGGNMGTCESLAQTVGNAASSHGYRVSIRQLDDAVDNVPSDQPVLIITSSYEGQPPDNATKFIEWIGKVDGKALSGVSYAVFGCGNRHWRDTFQRIPKIIDIGMAEAGAKRLVDRGVADASNNTISDDFEKWEDESFWLNVKKTFGGVDDPASDCAPALDLAISTSWESSYPSTEEMQNTVVLKNEAAAANKASMKRHIELQLPAGMKYRAGDYLTVLPKNPRATIKRVLRRFGLPWDATLYIKSKDTFLPHGTLLHLKDVLGSYVELTQPSTRRNLKTLMHHTSDPATKMNLTSLSGQYFANFIMTKRTSVLDLLEAHPAIDLPFPTYLAILPSLRPRQYSISSSPLPNPGICTLTYSVLDAPSFANQSRHFLGAATNYLLSRQPGHRLLATVQPSAPCFHLPQVPREAAPMIMLCTGTGIAPFRGFVQERAVLMAQGKKVGPAILYIGYRDTKMDRLYDHELESWAHIGAVDLRWACSRPEESEDAKVPSTGQYVQDRLWQDKDEIGKLMDREAMVFVCGSRAVADGVKGAMKRLRMEWQGGCCGMEEAEKWLDGLKGQRYMADIFD